MIRRMFLIIFFIVLISVVVVLDTDIGLALLIKTIPGEASAQKISGSIMHGWRITKFRYKTAGMDLAIDKIKVSWTPLALLKQNLMINEIQIKNINLTLLETSEKSSDFSLPSIHLPINIYLKNTTLTKLKIHKAGKIYFIKHITLSGNVVNNVLDIQTFQLITPDLHTESHGLINLNTLSSIDFSNKTTFFSYAAMPIFTHMTGDKHVLSLHVKSTQWLNVHLALQHYLDAVKEMTLQANWFIDTTRASFAELKKLNGKLQFSGKANGHVLHPNVSGKLLAQNMTYDTLNMKELKSTFDITLDSRQKISFFLKGKNIAVGDTLLNTINATILGSSALHHIQLHVQALDSYFISFATQGGFDGQHTYSFKNGRLDAGPLNLVFTPINMNISWEKNKTLAYLLTLQHKEEQLSLQGNTPLSSSGFETHLTLSSKKFTLIDTEAYKIIITPDLRINYTEAMTKISGNLGIFDATIAPIDLSNTVTLSNDIVYVNNNNEPLYQKKQPLQLFMDIAVTIKQLSVKYKGVQAKVTGETKLTQTPTTELSAYGQLKLLEGSYNAYGQALTIQEGSTISFNRVIDNPQLNITASKQIKVSPEYLTLPSYQPYLVAGVQVTGTADEPIIHLFSVPSGVSQQDILSYLIFGFPQNQLTNSQASALWSAFNMMDVSHGSFSLSSLQQNVQNELGLSEFGLGSTSEYNAVTQQYESGTAFVVGKRITDNLTATYNVGLLVPVNVLYLRYRLSQHWSLQSDSSALGNGGDIFYTIRRN